MYRIFQLSRRLRDPRYYQIAVLSPLITSLSLTLLLRADTVLLAACAAAIAISSKFLIRYRGMHVFNPANVAIVLMMLASEHVWVSSGQWGSTATG